MTEVSSVGDGSLNTFRKKKPVNIYLLLAHSKRFVEMKMSVHLFGHNPLTINRLEMGV